MENIKRIHQADFKAKVAVEMIRGTNKISEICSKYSIHPTQAGKWKTRVLENIANLFSEKHSNQLKQKDEIIDELYKQIGQLKVELDWLKKNLLFDVKKKLELIEPSNKNISIIRQCELLDISRSNYYYQPKPINPRELNLMKNIDEIYTEFPYYGSPKITAAIKRKDIVVNHKMIERLMRKMGLIAIFPRKNTSKSHSNHFKYPYLLKNLVVARINQVWGTDITFIRANGQWFYLVAIIDWFSRYIIAWKLSASLSSDFCVGTLKEALNINVPEIHNSDQGSQFIDEEYIKLLNGWTRQMF